MTTFTTVRLRDMGRIVTGRTPSSERPELFGSVVPFITPTDIVNTDRYVRVQRFLSTAGLEDLRAIALPPRAVCFVCIGATIGKICMTADQSVTNQQINSIIVDQGGFCPEFVYYALSTFKDRVKARAGGAATPIVNKSSFSDVEIEAPPLPVQRRIASILGAYDDLIEVNRRRIAILEDMARRLFEEWFVRFRYPGHEGVRLVATQEGPVPEGWLKAKLGDVCMTMRAGATPSRQTAKFWELGSVDWYTTGELQDCFLLGSKERISQGAIDAGKGRLFPAGTIFMAIYGSPTVGRLGISVEPCSANQAALAMQPDGRVIGLWFLWHTLWSRRAYFNSIALGAAQQNISKEKVRDAEIVVPPRHIIGTFERTVGPIWELRRNTEMQQKKLEEARDLLLPRLISGALPIAAAERELEAAD